MDIKILSQHLVNQIAAGEVIEKPSSVIKELMENAIDARATEVSISVMNAGKSLISVSDDGVGMDKQSLELSVLSHATSKLSEDNLFDIHTFGFRGEALPSIASIARVEVVSSTNNHQEGWKISVEGGFIKDLSPINRKKGTTVYVRDLFFATPARLKFLKSDASEIDSCHAVFNKIALSFPSITFKFIENDKEKFCYQATSDTQKRISDVFGHSFMHNVFEINVQMDQMKLSGYLGVPTFNKSTSAHQYFFVNNRFVKDKVFSSAIKTAYSTLAPNGRHPVAVLFFSTPYDEVDVNAHPAKTEIRFRNSSAVRNFLISSLKKALTNFGANIAPACTSDNFAIRSPSSSKFEFRDSDNKFALHDFNNKFEFHSDSGCSHSSPAPAIDLQNTQAYKMPVGDNVNVIDLGTPIFQLKNAYIISENESGIVIIDQHAAAERITLEKLKKEVEIDAQNLLIPEIRHVSAFELELLEKNKDILARVGVHFDIDSCDSVKVTALPAILCTCDAKHLIDDVIENLKSIDSVLVLDEKINHVLSTIACHNSLRAGTKLSHYEMLSMLEEMQRTTNIAQCCHGRPSFIQLFIKDINKLFERA